MRVAKNIQRLKASVGQSQVWRQSDIAPFVNMSRSTLSRTLKFMREHGVVSFYGVSFKNTIAYEYFVTGEKFEDWIGQEMFNENN